MTSTLNIVHKLDGTQMFKGLSAAAIKYLRKEGLWMPVTAEILEVEDAIRTGNWQIYVDTPERKNYLTFIIEHNEFLTAAVYSNIDSDAIGIEGYLHQYAMEDGALLFETVQAVHNGVLFLALTDVQGEFVIGWEEDAMEDILKL